MEQTHQDQNFTTDKVLAFDTIFTTNHLKMLKVLVSYLDPSLQKMLAVYIKFSELQFTLTYFDNHSSPYPRPESSSGNNLSTLLGNFGGLGNILDRFGVIGESIGSIDPLTLCSELLPYCTLEERKKVEQFHQMLQMLENFQQISQTMEMMKDLFPDVLSGFDSGPGNNNSQMFDMLAAMMNSSGTG